MRDLSRLVLDCPVADLLPGGAQAELLQTLRECRILSYQGGALNDPLRSMLGSD